jgi:hypothetical protein
MSIGWNELALLGQVAQAIVLLGLLALTIRDLRRGENGTTPGLMVLSLGLLITNALALFVTTTSHPLSHGGFIALDWSSDQYTLVISIWHTTAAWVTAIGLWMLGIYVYRMGQKK